MFVIDMARFIIRVNKKYHPQTLLEKCKYEIKNKNDLDPSSSDNEPDNESDSESNNESND